MFMQIFNSGSYNILSFLSKTNFKSFSLDEIIDECHTGRTKTHNLLKGLLSEGILKREQKKTTGYLLNYDNMRTRLLINLLCVNNLKKLKRHNYIKIVQILKDLKKDNDVLSIFLFGNIIINSNLNSLNIGVISNNVQKCSKLTQKYVDKFTNIVIFSPTGIDNSFLINTNCLMGFDFFSSLI